MSSKFFSGRYDFTKLFIALVVSFLLTSCGDPPGTSRRQSATTLGLKSDTVRIMRAKTFLDSISYELPTEFRDVRTFNIDFSFESSGISYLSFQNASTQNVIGVSIDGDGNAELNYVSFGPQQRDSLHKKAIELLRNRAETE